MKRQSGLFRIVHYIMGVRFSGVSVKRGSTVQQTLILDSLVLHLFNTSENCFSPSRCSLRLQVHFQLDNFLLSGQNVTCTCAFVLQSDRCHQSKGAEVNNFSRECYQALSSYQSLSSPSFWGTRLRAQCLWLARTLVV